MAIDRSVALARVSGIFGSEVDSDFVLMSIEEGNYFGFDAIGSEIWRRFEQPKTVEQLIAELQNHFAGDPAKIEAEALEFIEKLAGHKLLAHADMA